MRIELAGPRPHCHGRGQEAKDRIDALRAIERLEEEARRVMGSSMLRMLQLVLGDRLTLPRDPCPGAAEGLARQVAQVVDRFRWSLNCLADGWAARAARGEYAVVALHMPEAPSCWQPVMPTGMP
jgi:hypothetical protein